MGDAVLVPGYSAAESRLFDEDRIVERYKIFAINGGRYGQKVRVAVEPQTGG